MSHEVRTPLNAILGFAQLSIEPVSVSSVLDEVRTTIGPMAARERPETRSIPVIALTAAASERDRKRGEQAGFYRYLTKPVKVDELELAIEALLAQKSG